MPEPPSTYPGDEWEYADPGLLGLHPLRLAFAAALLSRPQSNARAFLVVQSGKIVFEEYFHGSTQSDRHHLFSVTKSVLGLLVGMTLADQLEQPVLDFFPEINLQPSNPFHLVTIRHLLTMTCGLIWPGGSRGKEPLVARMIHSSNWAEFILNLPVRRPDIGIFNYNSGASHLLALILRRATGLTACETAHERLFNPLGIFNVIEGTDWETDPAGNSIGGWGLHLTARELARIGWLAVCGGQWRGKPLVPRQWLDDSTRLPEGVTAGYGYHWWLRRVADQPVFAGIGMGGQYMFCVPNRQMVAVILSQSKRSWPDRWEILTELLA